VGSIRAARPYNMQYREATIFIHTQYTSIVSSELGERTVYKSVRSYYMLIQCGAVLITEVSVAAVAVAVTRRRDTRRNTILPAT